MVITGARKFFTWDILYECNYKCKYCFLNFEESSKNLKTGFLDAQKWINIWKDIYVKYGTCHIQVTGGEPFEYPNFLDILEGIAEYHSMDVSTNLSWDVGKFSKKADFRKIKIDSSFHPDFIGFKEFLEKLEFLRNQGYLVSVTMVAYPPMLDGILEYTEKFSKVNFKLIVYPYRGPYEGRLLPDEYSTAEKQVFEKIRKLAEGVTEDLFNTMVKTPTYNDKDYKKRDFNLSSVLNKQPMRQKTGEDKVFFNPKNNKLEMSDRVCKMGQGYAKIYPNGDAYRCCMSQGEAWGYMGNIIEGNFSFKERPEACPSGINCKCYKAMVLGQEKKWQKHWIDVPTVRMRLEVEKSIMSIRKELKFKKGDSWKQLLKSILEKYPNNARLLIFLSELLVERNSLAIADNLLDFVFKQHDDESESWAFRVLGTAYLQRWKLKSAVKAYKKALQLAEDSGSQPDKIAANMKLCFTYMCLGDFKSANHYLKRIYNMVSVNPRLIKRIELLFFRCASVLAERGDYKRAMKVVDSYLKKTPKSNKVGLLKSQILAASGMRQKAIKFLKGITKSEEFKKSDEYFRYKILKELGKISLDLKKAVEAKKYFERALSQLSDIEKNGLTGEINYEKKEICKTMSGMLLEDGDMNKAMKFIIASI